MGCPVPRTRPAVNVVFQEHEEITIKIDYSIHPVPQTFCSCRWPGCRVQPLHVGPTGHGGLHGPKPSFKEPCPAESTNSPCWNRPFVGQFVLEYIECLATPSPLVCNLITAGWDYLYLGRRLYPQLYMGYAHLYMELYGLYVDYKPFAKWDAHPSIYISYIF